MHHIGRGAKHHRGGFHLNDLPIELQRGAVFCGLQKGTVVELRPKVLQELGPWGKNMRKTWGDGKKLGKTWEDGKNWGKRGKMGKNWGKHGKIGKNWGKRRKMGKNWGKRGKMEKKLGKTWEETEMIRERVDKNGLRCDLDMVLTWC